VQGYVNISSKFFDPFMLTEGWLIPTSTNKTPLNYATTLEMESNIENSGIACLALRNYIPCIAHLILLAWGAFASSHEVPGWTNSWHSSQCHQQFADYWKKEVYNSQGHSKWGTAGFHLQTWVTGDNWDSMYFKTLCYPWHHTLYTRERLLYWFYWHLVIEAYSVTVC